MTAAVFFLAGLMVGSIAGVLIVVLCMAARRGDRLHETAEGPGGRAAPDANTDGSL